MANQFKEGNKRFLQDEVAARPEFYRKLVNQPAPKTLVITCMDSRIGPMRIIGADLGEAMVLRNPGNIVPPPSAMGGEAAGVELALTNAPIETIAVIGHSCCLALRALVERRVVSDTVTAWLMYAEGARAGELVEGESDILDRVAQSNVVLQLEHLRKHAVAARKEVQLTGLFYRVETGALLLWDPESRKFS